MNITREAEIHRNPVTSTVDAIVSVQPVPDKYYWILYKSIKGTTKENVVTKHPFHLDRSSYDIQNLLNWKEISAAEFTSFKTADEEILEKEVD
jgi:hypothetical protein